MTKKDFTLNAVISMANSYRSLVLGTAKDIVARAISLADAIPPEYFDDFVPPEQQEDAGSSIPDIKIEPAKAVPIKKEIPVKEEINPTPPKVVATPSKSAPAVKKPAPQKKASPPPVEKKKVIKKAVKKK